MIDIENDLTEQDRQTLNKGKPCQTDFTKLFYADDTFILASSHQAAELLLHNIQSESGKYNLSLNFKQCVLLRLNAIHNVCFDNGDMVPVCDSALYLGSNIFAHGNHPSAIQNSISVTLMTLKKLNTFWTKFPSSIKWKQRDVIVSKLLYGLEALSLTDSDRAKLDAFHIRGLRQILGIKH
eukprot:3610411-Heterocapsa_arctica.AAC.1